mgnify:FL=1
MYMRSLLRMLVAVLLVAGLTAPVSAFAALGVPFGGRVASIFYCLNGGIYETIVGVRGGAFVWTPAALTFRNYQTRPGVNQVGLADIAYPCVISFKPLIVWYGLRIQMVGTSLAI